MKEIVSFDLSHIAEVAGSSEEQQEVNRAVLNAVRQLPIGPRQAVVLRHWHDSSYAEIAEELRIPVNTVGVWLKRSHHKLSVLLSEFAP